MRRPRAGTTGRNRLDENAIALTLLTSLIWAGNTIAVKIALQDVPPFRLGWMRFLLGGLSILAWAWMTHAPLRIHRGERSMLVFIGLLFAVQIGLFHLGTNLTTAGHTVVLINVNPIHVVLLAHLFVPGDRLTAQKLGSVLVAYAGIVLIFLRQLRGSEGSFAGDLIVSVAAVVLAIRTIALNRAVQRIDPTKVLLVQATVGLPLFLLLDFFLEGGIPTRYTAPMALSLGYQGILVSGVNFIINLWLLKHYLPGALAPFYLTIPLFGVLLSAWIVGEALTGYLVAGAILVAGGIGLSTLPARVR